MITWWLICDLKITGWQKIVVTTAALCFCANHFSTAVRVRTCSTHRWSTWPRGRGCWTLDCTDLPQSAWTCCCREAPLEKHKKLKSNPHSLQLHHRRTKDKTKVTYANDIPGVRTTTDMVMSEQTTTITSREMAMPFQFLCGGLTCTNSCSHTKTNQLVWIMHGWNGIRAKNTSTW